MLQSRSKPAVVVALLLAFTTTAQNLTGSTSRADGSEIFLCNSTIGSANASGVFTFAVDYPIANQSNAEGTVIRNIPDPSWAITVDVQNGTTQTSIWYDTAGQDYSDDLSINYDVCAYAIGGLPINTLELGQDDNGDCSTMFSQECITTLRNRAASSAHQWVSYSSPPPYQNLTVGVLPYICSYILRDLADPGSNYPYPEACRKPFGEDELGNPTVGINIMTLTGYNDSLLDNGPCTLHRGNKSFKSTSTSLAQSSIESYDNATRNIHPILSVYMPVANVDRKGPFTSWANSSLQCVRTRDFNATSRVPPALAAGKPYNYSKGLSGGAIGGIVVGVVVGVAIIAGLSLWFCWLKPRRRKRAQAAQSEKLDGGAMEKKLPDVPEAEGGGVSELSPVDRKPEMDSSPVHELGAKQQWAEIGGGPIAEMDGGGGKPVELAGSTGYPEKRP